MTEQKADFGFRPATDQEIAEAYVRQERPALMELSDWKLVTEIRIQVTDSDCIWSFPIKCPRLLFKLLEKLEL